VHLRWWHVRKTACGTCTGLGSVKKLHAGQKHTMVCVGTVLTCPQLCLLWGVLQVIRKTPAEIEAGMSHQHEAQLIAVATDLGE
jgi:hypothetical protein